MPDISVVVATYNRGVLLQDLLRDLAAQTIAPARFEVVLVDDGSKEPVKPFVDALTLPYALTLIAQANAGQAAARDRGIRLARGELVVIVDDDMRLGPDFLAEHLHAHEAGADVVMGLIVPPPDAELPLFEKFHADQLLRFARDAAAGKKPVRGVHLATGNVSFRRSDYVAVGGFDRSLKRSEDRELGIRLEKAGKRLAVSEKARSLHHTDHGSDRFWHQRSFDYGIYDLRISAKHPDEDSANPFSYLWLVHPVSRPLLVMAMAAPGSARWAARGMMKAAKTLDALGFERSALRACTFVFGIEYFRGVRAECGTLLSTMRRAAAYAKSRRATDPTRVLRRTGEST
jgi:GT2 family glycosyltransferase